MSTTKKFLYGFLAFAPIPFFVLYIYTFFSRFIQNIPTLENNPEQFPTELFQDLGIIFLYAALAGFISLTALIVYILDAMKNKNFEGNNSNMKIIWVLIFLFLSSIGMIVYFFSEIIPRKENENYTSPPITDRTN